MACRGTRSYRPRTSRRAAACPWRAQPSWACWRSWACVNGAWTTRAGEDPAMSDTFFSGAPHWTWLILLYFFVGGVAGGAAFLAAVLDWVGGAEDRPVARSGYNVAAVGAIVSGALLTIDLGRPLRFWHMLFQSANFPALMFKGWSPISFGAWGVLLFGLFSVLAALGGMAEQGRLHNPTLRAVGGAVHGGVAKLVGGVACPFGDLIARDTGGLPSVAHRPPRAASPWRCAVVLPAGLSDGTAAPLPAALRDGGDLRAHA